MNFEKPPISADNQRKDQNKKFEEANEQEQKIRFQKLADLIRPGEKGNMYDFLDNAYKYLNNPKFEDTYKSGIDAITIARKYLKYFLEYKRGGAKGCIDADKNIEYTKDEDQDGSVIFVDRKTGEIDLKKVSEYFDRSLGSFVADNGKMGRPTNIKEEEISQYVNDLNSIFDQVEESRKILKITHP